MREPGVARQPPLVDVLGASDTHDLRRRVLRGGDPGADVRFPNDEDTRALHLGLRDGDGRVVAVASFAPGPWPAGGAVWPGEPGSVPWRLRGMAVDPAWQGRGWGTHLLAEGVVRVRAAGASVLWADARDTALDFYRRHGWEIVGEGFVTAIGVAHHLAVLSWRSWRERPGPAQPGSN